MNKSLYEILGVENSATPEEIRMAYKRLAAKHHPDKGGDDEVFAEIEEAYRVLKDAVNRTHYDETGENSLPKEKQIGRDRLATLFGVAIQKLITSPNSPHIMDGYGFDIKSVLDFVERELNNAIDTSNQELGKHQQNVQKLISYKDKIQTNNGAVNLFDGVINQGMEEAKSNIRMLEFRVLVDQSSLDMLDDYVCTLEAEQIEGPRRYMNYLGTGGML